MPALRASALFSLLALVSRAGLAEDLSGFCEPPAQATALQSPTVIGTGTPGSVTTAALQAALDAGGHVLLDAGGGTIPLTATLLVTRETVLDGGGATLSGQGARRVFLIDNPSNVEYTLTLQHLTVADGATPSGSGAGLYKPSGGPWQAVSLVAVDVTWRDNVAIEVAQDDGGGAIYATGMKDLRLVDQRFLRNRGSNGGAVYSLGSDQVLVHDALFEDNRATGFGANPGNGGNGGAIGVDGAERTFSVCGGRFVANRANAHGGAFFSVMYDDTSSSSFIASSFTGNLNPTPDDHTGGVYVQGGPFEIRNSTFSGNEAEGIGALFVGPDATGDIVNSTFVGNVARTGLAGAIFIATDRAVAITHTTIADNHAPGELAFAGGIQVDASNAVTLTSSILFGNTGGNVYNPWNIRNPVGDGGGNVQYPLLRPNGQADPLATPTVLGEDPLLATLADNGGPTQTMALGSGSPAIDLGTVAGAPATDQRGLPRVSPPDAGAVEAAPITLEDFESGDLSRWLPQPPP